MNIQIIELCDRYLVIDAETGENIEFDHVGFSDEQSALRWANEQGHTVLRTED